MVELGELIERADIVEYVSQYVDLEEKGGEYWGISPFTYPPEKTPSFSIRKENGSFYDFSSGIGGNVFTFIKYYNKCSTREAVDILKKYVGVDDEIGSPREKMSTTLSCKKFSRPIHRQKESKTSVLRENYMDRYEDRPDKLLIWEQEGISREAMRKFQVRYDSFSNRLVYPIRNINGDIVNIGGRTLDQDWKDRKIRKYTYFFSWGNMDIIYGLSENMDEILKKREIILFEGAKSVMIASTWGINNTGAILTSHLNPNQLKILARLGCRVVFALDKEVRVRDDHNISKLKNYVSVEYLYDPMDLLDNKDSPVDKGEEVFKKLYEGRLRYR